MANNDATKMVFFAVTDPTLMVVDFAELDKTAAENRKARDLANPPKPQNAYQEYKQLKGKLYQLEQRAQNTAVYLSNIEGTVALIEKNLATAEARSKAQMKAGNEHGQRFSDHGVDLFKTELDAAKKDLTFAKASAKAASKAFASFDQHERIVDLAKQLGL